jgi:ABC-type transport system substrate-binding protein
MIMGTGPFIMESATDEKIVWKANEKYWRASADIKEMHWIVNDDSISCAQGLLAGNYDIAAADSSYYGQLEASPNVFFKEGAPGFLQYYLGINNNKYNLNQRSAMAYAFNYTYALEQVFSNTRARMKSIIPSGIEYGRDDLDYPDTDYAIARQFMLDEYGGSLVATSDPEDATWIAKATDDPFFVINFTFFQSNTWTNLKDLLVDNLKRIGIECVGIPATGSQLSQLTNVPENHDKIGIMVLGWGPDYLEAANQVDNNFHTGNSGNWLQYSNPTVDANLVLSYVTTDYEARKVLFDEIQQEINDDVPIIYLFRSKTYEIHSNYLSNWYGNPMTDRQTYYLAHWNPPIVADIDEGGIPGFNPAYLVAVAGVVALLLMKKIKK